MRPVGAGKFFYTLNGAVIGARYFLHFRSEPPWFGRSTSHLVLKQLSVMGYLVLLVYSLILLPKYTNNHCKIKNLIKKKKIFLCFIQN